MDGPGRLKKLHVCGILEMEVEHEGENRHGIQLSGSVPDMAGWSPDLTAPSL